VEPSARQNERSTGVMIRDAEAVDIGAITEIQNAFIATAAIEWTDVLHDVDDRRAWLMHQRAAGHPVLVAVIDDRVVGWASYGEFRDSRKWPGYRLTVEHTIHVGEEQWGSGVGRRLMEELVERATNAGLHAMIAAVDGENTASVRFHERLGFQEVARMPQVGTKFGKWLDLVLLERVLDDAAPPPA
jgi:phosphinothricin acetyltransferase